MKVKRSLSLLLIAIALFVVAESPSYGQRPDAPANEWLQFRGPNGTGVSEGFPLPAEFSSTKNLAWKTPVPFARSSPVITADRIFLTASEGDKLITLALDRKNGKVLWRREVVRARHMPIYKANDGASPTPVSDGRNVIAFFAELEIAFISANRLTIELKKNRAT